MLRFNPTVPLWFYAKRDGYASGAGTDSIWIKVLKFPLYCEWKGGYGDRAIAAEALGVSNMATVRTFFHPLLYETLHSCTVLVSRDTDSGAEESKPNVYEVWGGTDNVENRFLEFRVRRYQAT